MEHSQTQTPTDTSTKTPYILEIGPKTETPEKEIGSLLIPLPTPVNAKKRNLKVVEIIKKGRFDVTVYKYKVTNYGYTVTDAEN